MGRSIKKGPYVDEKLYVKINKLNDQRAFAFLTRLSQHQNIKLHRIAEQINDTTELPPEK